MAKNKANGKPVGFAKTPEESPSTGDNTGISMDGGVPHARFQGAAGNNSEMVTVEIDLTDPEDLTRKLKMIELTDEETDELLRQALEINKTLRKELNKRNLSDNQPPVQRSSSFLVSAPSSSCDNGTMSAPCRTLPPLKTWGASSKNKNRQGSGISHRNTSTLQPSPYTQKSEPQNPLRSKSGNSSRSSASSRGTGRRKPQQEWQE